MKKLIAMLVTVLYSVPMIVAQESVSGVVVDKKGNPLPGVRIEVPGSSDWTVSDLDGTFTITPPFGSKKVQATYAGMNSRKVKLKDGMRIKMKEGNWWTQKPDEWNWMVNAIVALPNDPDGDIKNPAYGFMISRIKRFGYYVKGVTNTFGVSTNGERSKNLGFIEKEKSTYWSVTGGAIVRLGCPIHLYLGAGYADYVIYVKDHRTGEWYYGEEKKRFAVDLGLILRIKRFDISVGYCGTNGVGQLYGGTFYAGEGAGNFGIGYSF